MKWNETSIELEGKTHSLPTTKNYILREYTDVFKEVGSHPCGPYHIRLKQSYKPVQHPPRSVPIGMQSAYKAETLKVLHLGHYAINKMQLRARETVFCLGISKDIETAYKNCNTSTVYTNSQQKETLLPHKVLDAAWESLGTDIFQLNNQYLLVVDHCSQFLVIRKITNLTSKTLITQFKSIFAEYGIPKTIISDGGTQYTPQEFTRLWQIEHIKSLSRNPQSNVLAERFVQTVKTLYSRLHKVGEIQT